MSSNYEFFISCDCFKMLTVLKWRNHEFFNWMMCISMLPINATWFWSILRHLVHSFIVNLKQQNTYWIQSEDPGRLGPPAHALEVLLYKDELLHVDDESEGKKDTANGQDGDVPPWFSCVCIKVTISIKQSYI